MRQKKARFFSASLAGIWGVVLFGGLPGAAAAYFQAGRKIDSGTNIQVRTNERITSHDADERVFTGSVEQDVLSRNGRVAIPRGSEVEMLVRQTDRNEYALDLDSVTVNGRRYGVDNESS